MVYRIFPSHTDATVNQAFIDNYCCVTVSESKTNRKVFLFCFVIAFLRSK